ncbi:ATP-binding protein [Dethiosulfovibrio salsuginis]|uniref:MinD superfamily P-loop ATPase, contains an inserted ferredoxin domain n=1 Tax=Dethiosulfovibrio salsuginis TaxID=561720 RepID=A0A1X7JTL1_9BACT|nr:ATP-binding protein [Dethiosulfovibrio salsuginis]SMG31722.1 MinD superfamily P-loop ATPase, contains an inserted ferredoxin domain [Dethiosulfovibrio salsuginis]
MREIVVVSGKGGTGKTSITASLASIASQEGAALCDADVDAPDLWILVPPERQEKFDFIGMDGAEVSKESCTGCGACLDFCRFDAIRMEGKKATVTAGCEGCGGCAMVCPKEAITMVPRQQGRWFKAITHLGPMVYARLFPGGENSGMLVTTVKRAAKEEAQRLELPNLIVDGPPGIACPAIAAVTGASLALAVTEPTESGIHDLKRLHQLTADMDIPMAVVLNKSDVTDMAPRVREVCRELTIPLIGEIPFSRDIPESVASGSIPVEHMRPSIDHIWQEIKRITG